MKTELAYRSSEPPAEGRGADAEVVVVDTSATTHGATITTRRHIFHEGTVLASRVAYLMNREAADV